AGWRALTAPERSDEAEHSDGEGGGSGLHANSSSWGATTPGGGGPYTSAFPPSVISATFMVGEEAVSSKHKSFPTMTMFLSISSEVEATVIPSTGKAMCPFSIQNPAAW